MRFLLLSVAFGLFIPAAASADAPSAQATFVERRGLLEADTQCRLFSPEIRSALEAGAGQARGALLRGGWTSVRLQELERAAIGAARARACDNPRTTAAAQSARLGFASWVRTAAMDFPGRDRLWSARRTPDPLGWRLSQHIDAPVNAIFGVRQNGAQQNLTLVIALTPGQAAPASVQLWLRDPARASNTILDLPGRTVSGLAAGAPSPANAQRFFASGRTIETSAHGARQAAFIFPDSAFTAMMTLDPREAGELHLQTGRDTQRVLLEIGDVAAARAFLALNAPSTAASR